MGLLQNVLLPCMEDCWKGSAGQPTLGNAAIQVGFTWVSPVPIQPTIQIMSQLERNPSSFWLLFTSLYSSPSPEPLEHNPGEAPLSSSEMDQKGRLAKASMCSRGCFLVL